MDRLRLGRNPCVAGVFFAWDGSMEPADSQIGISSTLSRVGALVMDKWHIDALLGEGGMAAVYAATHRNGSRVAIKMLHVELSRSMNIRARFRREG
jgi:serine/threonine protein kinase